MSDGRLHELCKERGNAGAVAALLLGEKLGPLDMIGVAIVGGGILAVQLARQGGPKPVPKTPRSVV